MDADAIRAITFGVAFVVFLGYVVFVVWRIRVHRRRDEAEEGQATSSTMSSDAMLHPVAPAPPSTPPSGATPVASPAASPLTEEPGAQPADTPPVREESGTPRHQPQTVLEAVQGISLPHDLVPHPDAAPRPGAIDRVALTGTMVEFETLRDGVTEALNGIGYELIWADTEAMARNGAAELRVTVYTSPRTATFEGVPAFPLAGEGAVVVDFWIAAEG